MKNNRLFLLLIPLLAAFQLQTNSEVLILSGEIAFWNQGVAQLELAGSSAIIDETGAFTLFLKTPSEDLIPVRDYFGISNCLVSTNSSSQYRDYTAFDVVLGDQLYANLYSQTPRFNFQPGDAFQEFHYYSEATTVSGHCTDIYDSGFSTIYVFPDLQMQQGWNHLTGFLTETSDSSETYVFSLDDKGTEFRWELEALPLENENDYIGLGFFTDYAEDGAGFVLSEIYTNSPAEQAGLMAGDIVTHVNGEDVRSMNSGAYVLRISGSEGEAVALKILREAEVLDFRVIRGRVVVE